jgi:hypothetical protein
VDKLCILFNNLNRVVVASYLGGLLWYRFSDYILPTYFMQQEPLERSFVISFNLKRLPCESDLGELETVTNQVIWCMYFMLTTLSTVGYGDLYPVSMSEKIFGCIL